MKTRIPMEKPEDGVVEVGCEVRGGLVTVHLKRDGRYSHMQFEPDQAVKLWRVMGAEQYNSQTATDAFGHSFMVSVGLDKAGRITEDCGDMYTVKDDKGKVLLTLTPDQATALAWQIKRCCEEALNTDDPGGRKIPSVWVLSWRRLLTGDAAGNGTELIGGGERVYMTKEGALFDLPDILREFVKDSHPEGHFGPDEEGLGERVEKVMNDASNNGHQDIWLYDGSTQSFEVELLWIPVRP